MSRAYSSFSPNLGQKNNKSFNFNFSLDVKSYMKKKTVQMSLTNKFKKNQIDEINLKSAYSTPIHYVNIKKQNTNQSIKAKQQSSKSIKEKKRFSLIENMKNECSKHQSKNSQIEDQLISSKYQKIKQLLKEEKYILSITQIKQLLAQIQDKKRRKQLYFWLIISFIKSNRLQQAEQYAFKCLSQFPSFYQVILCSAQISFKMKKIAEAIKLYEKAIIIQQTTSQAYIQLSQLYSLQNQHIQAYEVLIEGFKKSQKSVTIPIKIIQNLLLRDKIQQTDFFLARISQIQSEKSSDYFYVKGIIEQKKKKYVESCIYYQQSIKLNTNKSSVAKSLQNQVIIQIQQRDFYSAYHNIKRCKHLKINFKKLEAYQVFLEGAILIMKKMYSQGIQTLSQFLIKFKEINFQIHQLIKKYLAYASFKLGNHAEAIKYYRKIDQKSKDQVSTYNLLLAEGIQYVDKKNQFQKGIKKFQEAKKQYPTKVQPFIYISMAMIKKINQSTLQGEQKYQAVIKALQILDQAQIINSSSSNLLYHRAIVFLFFQDYDQAHKDINRCIQKAQQNLPKYFYLRGICYSCIKQLKKATNQFSIAISLDKQYSQAYLQRSKCYFLLGQSDRGFQDLKQYMQLKPEDLSVHHWIGDLLYEGSSYQDALKAYNQMGTKIDQQTLCMKIKCQLKLGQHKIVQQTFKKIEKLQNYREQKYALDKICLQILTCLIGNQCQKTLNIKLNQLNKQLQICSNGKIFTLVDCMLLIGISSFYLNRFKQAYQSFRLTLQLYKSLSNSQLVVKTSYQEQFFCLKIQDIYLNLLITLLCLGDKNQIQKIIKEQMIPFWKDKCHIKLFSKILKSSANQFLSHNKETFYIDHRIQTIYSKKMKKIQVLFKSLVIKTSLIFVPFHQNVDTLYSNNKAKSMINKFHAGFIDNMPEAPWIKRNQYGVIFTDQIIRDESNFTFLSTNRNQQQKELLQDSRQKEEKVQDKNKQTFLRQMRLDLEIQKKLNKIISKNTNHTKK